MKIAIIGGGFAGLAASHYLSPFGDVSVFDRKSGAASSIAAGLLHKFVGLHAKKNNFGDEALALSLQLIDVFDGPKKNTGLLRIAQTEDQAVWFRKSAAQNPTEIELVDENSIWIKDAWVVDCPSYLSKLPIIEREIENLSELDHFDLIVIAAGAASLRFANLPITPVKGQLLELKGSPPPKTPLSGQIYLIPLEDREILGSTYERDRQVNAEEELIPKLKQLYPPYQTQKILEVKSAYRASSPGHMPFIKQLNNKTWAFGGLGSKGLLYHAYYGQKLAHQIRESL